MPEVIANTIVFVLWVFTPNGAAPLLESPDRQIAVQYYCIQECEVAERWAEHLIKQDVRCIPTPLQLM
jgi:uncharacterized protein with GYD domain